MTTPLLSSSGGWAPGRHSTHPRPHNATLSSSRTNPCTRTDRPPTSLPSSPPRSADIIYMNEESGLMTRHLTFLTDRGVDWATAE